MMRRLFTYIFLILAALSCSRNLENDLEQGNKVVFAANCSGMATKASIQYTDFDVYTKYLIYCIESSDSYDWAKALMYDRQGTENESHLIEYGKDVFFDGKKIDLFGATLCSTRALPDNINQPQSPIIDFRLETYGTEFPDLMYSNNAKERTAKEGLIEMNFKHALSKVQVEVSRQDDQMLGEIQIKKVSLANTSSKGRLDIVNGTWSDYDTEGEFIITDEPTFVSTEPVMLTKDGRQAYALIIPNETSEETVFLNITLTSERLGEKTYSYPLYTPPHAESSEIAVETPFIFEQNHRYTFSIILLRDGVRVIAVEPQVYDWIEEEVPAYMGQPVNFGGLMWMDRNLGATSADCENDWANTRGFYYQFGRNIPYILDQEKFVNRNRSVKNVFRTQEGKTSQLDIGYEYFYTYNEKGEKVYGAVQGGTQKWHYFYHVAAMEVNGEKVGWVNNGAGWEWQGSRLSNVRQQYVPHYTQTTGTFNSGLFWTAEQVGHNGTSSNTGWTESNGAPQWREPNVTSSNIAINPGDPGLYYFIWDARYYTDYLQSGAWCVMDCNDCSGWEEWRPMSLGEWNSYYPGWTSSSQYPTLKGWMLDQGCMDTRTEDTEKVNYYWTDRNGTPIPENHPCPKGWRIPTKEDFAGIMPDHNIENTWGRTGLDPAMFILNETYGDVLTQHKEAAAYGIDHLGRKVIYLIKRKGENECYRLRLMWKDSNLTRNEYYGLGSTSGDYPMQYLEIARYPGNSDMSFDKYFNASVGSLITTNTGQSGSVAGVSINKTVRMMTGQQLNDLGFLTDFNWETPTEVMQIPICGFIYTAMGVDGMYADGDMTILRCTDWTENYDLARKLRPVSEGGEDMTYSEGNYPYNEGMNWCAYIRTDRNTGLFSGSRKTLGDQIRCVRDVNAK